MGRARIFSRNLNTKVGLSGFADRRGDSSFNQILSERRVSTVQSYLLSRGVKSNQILTNAFGESQPISKEESSENDFFDYKAKYEGASQEITPARISHNEQKRVEEVAIKTYEALKMSGFTRSEFILIDGEPYLLEINTVPGLTQESILPQQAQTAGISLPQLFSNAIEMALTTK